MPSATISLASADGTLNPEMLGDQAGFSLVGGGDINGDGIDELVVGAPAGCEGVGCAYVLFGGWE